MYDPVCRQDVSLVAYVLKFRYMMGPNISVSSCTFLSQYIWRKKFASHYIFFNHEDILVEP